MLPGKSHTLVKQVEAFNEANNTRLLANSNAAPATTARQNTPPRPRRTLCEPSFEAPEIPVDFCKTWTPEARLLQGELEAKE